MLLLRSVSCLVNLITSSLHLLLVCFPPLYTLSLFTFSDPSRPAPHEARKLLTLVSALKMVPVFLTLLLNLSLCFVPGMAKVHYNQKQGSPAGCLWGQPGNCPWQQRLRDSGHPRALLCSGLGGCPGAAAFWEMLFEGTAPTLLLLPKTEVLVSEHCYNVSKAALSLARFWVSYMPKLLLCKLFRLKVSTFCM